MSTYLVNIATTMSSWSGDVNEVFPHKACINLDRDPDSCERLQAALTRHDIRGGRRVSADCATGFKSCVKLTEADMESIGRNKFAKGIDLRTYGQSEEGPPFVHYGLFRRNMFRGQGSTLL
jgi:hypothetical protein